MLQSLHYYYYVRRYSCEFQIPNRMNYIISWSFVFIKLVFICCTLWSMVQIGMICWLCVCSTYIYKYMSFFRTFEDSECIRFKIKLAISYYYRHIYQNRISRMAVAAQRLVKMIFIRKKKLFPFTSFFSAFRFCFHFL